MASFNQVILMGNLGRDPEIKTTASGQTVANFSIATSKKVKGEDVTHWHNIVLWGQSAEFLGAYGGKGCCVQVVGELQHRKWQDKEGKDRWSTEVVCNQVTLITGKRDGEQRQEPAGQNTSAAGGNDQEPPFQDDDIPFS